MLLGTLTVTSNQLLSDQENNHKLLMGQSSSNATAKGAYEISMVNMKERFMKLNELRLNHQFCDITLIVGERNIAAHKNVLSISSAYFSAMFACDMVESKAATVELHDLDGDAVGSIIDFIYTAQLPLIDDSNVQVLLSAASLLQVEEIQRSCCDYLRQQLDTSNCLGLRDVAEKYSCPDLFSAANDLILDEFEKVSKNEEFLQLRTDQLIEIISEDRLNVTSEEHVYEAVMEWMGHKNSSDDEDRIVHLADVLEHVRFSQMRPDYIVKVSKNPLVESSDRCRENIGEAKNYFLSYVIHILRGESLEVPDEFCTQRYRPRIRGNSGEKLYVFGGSSRRFLKETKFERYDPETNSWTQLANIIKPEIAIAGALDGVLYAIGGYHDASCSKRILSYHIDTDKWTSDVVAPLSSARSFMGLATLNAFLYVIGGWRQPGVILNLVEKYDPSSNRWSTCSSLTTSRYHHGIATLDGYIYVVGGWGANGSLNTVERYDPKLDQWQLLAPMTIARRNLGCAAFGGYVYAVGGYTGDDDCLASVERYDPNKDIWELIPSMSERRSWFGAAFVNGLLYAVGGYNNSGSLNTVEVYNPVKEVWSSGATMPQHRADFAVFVAK